MKGDGVYVPPISINHRISTSFHSSFDAMQVSNDRFTLTWIQSPLAPRWGVIGARWPCISDETGHCRDFDA
jgi:hypothetical protein